MRVLHLLPQFPYFGGHTIVGGYASAVLNLSEAQVVAGHHVTIAGRVDHATPSTTQSGATIVSMGDVAQAGQVRDTLVFAARSLKWVRGHRSDFDVIHVHSGFADYLPMTGAIAHLVSVPVAHTLYCPVHTTGKRAALQRVALRTLPTKVRLVGMSEHVCDSIAGQYKGRRPVAIPPSIDTDRWAAGPASRTEHQRLEVTFVGNATPEKGLEVLVRALAQISAQVDFRLTVTTELRRTSANDAVAQVWRVAEECGIDARIDHKGIVDDMKELLRRTDVHVAPFLHTRGPSDYFMSSLEAMASGCAIVASDLPGMREVVTPGTGLLVTPGDPDALAAALMQYRDATYRRDVGQAAHDRIRKFCDPSTVAAQYDSVYSD